MVHIFLFSLIISIICTKPNTFLFLLYRSYFATKKNDLDGPNLFKCYWRDLRKKKKKKRYFSKRSFGNGNVMVWRSFCSRRTLPLLFYFIKEEQQRHH